MTAANARTSNRNAHTHEDLAPYLGPHVAWSEDCATVLFAYPTSRSSKRS